MEPDLLLGGLKVGRQHTGFGPLGGNARFQLVDRAPEFEEPSGVDLLG